MVTALLGAGLHAQPAGPLAAQPATQLTFAWTDGATAEVTYSVDGWRKNGGTTTTIRRMSKYDLRVRVADDLGDGAVYEIRRIWPALQTRVHSPSSLFGKPIGHKNALQNLIDDVPEFVPLLRVNEEGQLVSIGGTEEIDARLELALEESEANAATRRQAEALLSEESLHVMSHQTWASLVTLWNGRNLEDFPIGDRSSADVPSEPLRVEVPGKGTLEGWTPCHEEDAEELCVRLKWSASPQGDDAEEALEALERRAIDGLRLTREITVVVDPVTLLPYSTVDVLKANRTIQGRSELSSSEEVTRTRAFSWTLP